jgi:hypothetical protein
LPVASWAILLFRPLHVPATTVLPAALHGPPDWGARPMTFLKNEAVTLALLFSSFALYLVVVSPSVWTGLLLVTGLAHVWALIWVATANRL